MNKFFMVFAIIAVLFSSAVFAAEGRQQPGSRGVYLGGADGNFFGNYVPSPSLTGYATFQALDRDIVLNNQAKVVKGEKLLEAGNSVTSKNGINFVYQNSGDNLVLTITVPKNKMNYVTSMNFGPFFNILLKDGKLFLLNPKDFSVDNNVVAKQDSNNQNSVKQ